MRYNLDAFACPHCHRNEINPLFVRWFNREIVDPIESAADIQACGPIKVVLTSGWRCHHHDSAVGGKGVHTKGIAADWVIRPWLSEAIPTVVEIILASSAGGIGMRIHGEYGKRFFHTDLRDGERYIWTYNARG